MSRQRIVGISIALAMMTCGSLAHAQNGQQGGQPDSDQWPGPTGPASVKPGGSTADETDGEAGEPSEDAPDEAGDSVEDDIQRQNPVDFDFGEESLIRPDRSPVNPNEFDKIRPDQSPVNPNEFDKIRPDQSPVNPNEFEKIRPDETGLDDDIQVRRAGDLRVNPNEFEKIRPDETGLAGDIRVMSLDELRVNPNEFAKIRPDETGFSEGIRVVALDDVRVNPNTFRAIHPDDAIVLRAEQLEQLGRLETPEDLARLREEGASERAHQFQTAFMQVQQQAFELEPGSDALPLQAHVAELTRGADELRIRFTRVGRDLHALGRDGDANRARKVARLFAELQSRLALVGLELERRGQAELPNDLELNLELIEQALGF